MFEFVGKECSRCGACVQVCPVGCISLDGERARIDSEKCLHCDACRKHCHLLGQMPLKTVQKAYVAVAAAHLRPESASGGAFAALASTILEKGGLVFGSAWADGAWRAGHIGVESVEDLFKLQGSKYVESDTGNTYVQVKQALKDGKKVLFSGTPCQIAGLYSFLGKPYENLITVDIVCHGVPKEELFEQYIAYYEQKNGCKVIKWNFRAHRQGVQGCLGEVSFRKKGNTRTAPVLWNCDTYYFHFMHGTCYQQRCYSCPYAQRQRVGDITLGDFWGIEKLFPGEKAGAVSLVLVNSNAGESIVHSCRYMSLRSADVEVACAGNGQLNAPTPKPEEISNRFWQNYDHGGWKAVDEDFQRHTRLQRVKAWAVYYTPQSLKKWIRKLRSK